MMRNGRTGVSAALVLAVGVVGASGCATNRPLDDRGPAACAAAQPEPAAPQFRSQGLLTAAEPDTPRVGPTQDAPVHGGACGDALDAPG